MHFANNSTQKVYKANMNYQRHIKNIHKDIWGDGLKAPNCLLAPAVMGRKGLDRIEDGISKSNLPTHA